MSGQSGWKRMGRLTAHDRLPMIGAVLCALIGTGATLIGPLLIGRIVDLMTGEGRLAAGRLWVLLGLLGLTFALGSLFGWALTVLLQRMAYGFVHAVRTNLFRKLNELPLHTLDSHPHGDLISRFVNDADTVSDGLQQGLSATFTSTLTLLGTLGFMLWTSVKLTGIVLLLAVASFFFVRFLTLRSQRLFREQAKVTGTLNGYIEEMIGGQKTVQALRLEDRAYAAFKEKNDELYRAGMKAQFYGSLANPSSRLVSNVTFCILSIFCCLAILRHEITIGALTGFIIYANQFSKPVNEITGVLSQIQAAVVSMRRIFEILDLPAETPDPDEDRTFGQPAGEIVFDRISFAYRQDRPLIRNFSLSVRPGMKIAIVGSTGAGKTTLVNLLMRFYDTDQGSIRMDGIPIDRMPRDRLRLQFGMVLQDTWLFHGRIRDNIAYGKPDASHEEIVAAAKAADAHGFIQQLPEGYDTVVSASGGSLSQGQMQLLTIARVMLADPPMLILDEATSSIDTRTEARIQRAFQRMTAGRTSFVIAHRLSTIRESDLILYMHHGDIVEMGSHSELLRTGGHYAALYASQYENQAGA
ncbi:ABC transporter ATP-binding protein [Gorillibacterium sp. sgz5001074]|uniref:ABC transporter ATP-binding protein n=1 Tax=Gorillibacterium sp. sgz5001074 TaxID=3446695 RepID=UPI003F66AFBE